MPSDTYNFKLVNMTDVYNGGTPELPSTVDGSNLTFNNGIVVDNPVGVKIIDGDDHLSVGSDSFGGLALTDSFGNSLIWNTNFDGGLEIAGSSVLFGSSSIHGTYPGLAIGDDEGNFYIFQNGLNLQGQSLLDISQAQFNGGGYIQGDGNYGLQFVTNPTSFSFSDNGIMATDGLNASAQNGTVGTTIFEKYTDAASTTSTSIQTLYSHAIVSGLFAANGDKIVGDITVSIASTGGATKTVGITAFGTQIYTTGALTVATAGYLTLRVLLIRISATSVRCVVTPSAFTVGTLTPTVTDVTGLSLASTGYTLLCTATVATGAATGDVTAKADVIQFLPYSGN